jgi:predicted O-linked N-acetylglucosamine transferase (SPINDLY family)
MNLERIRHLIYLLRSSYTPTFEFQKESLVQYLSSNKSWRFDQVLGTSESNLTLPVLIQCLTATLDPNDRYLEVNQSGEWTTSLGAILHDRPVSAYIIQNHPDMELTLDDERILDLPEPYLNHLSLLQTDSEMNLPDILAKLKEDESDFNLTIVLLPSVPNYRQHFLHLLTIVPFLGDSALLLTQGANYPWMVQANQDLQDLYPQAKLLIDLSLKNNNLGDSIEGIQILGFGEYWVDFCTQNVAFNPSFLEMLRSQIPLDSAPCLDIYRYSIYEQTIQEALQDAVNYHGKGDLELAKNCYWQVLQKDLNQDLAWANLSTIAFEENNRDEALQFIYTAATINPKNDRYWRNLGLIFKRSRDFKQSIYYFEKAFIQNDRSPANYLGLAKVLEQAGQFERANLVLQQGLNQYPNDLLLTVKHRLLKPLIYKNMEEVAFFHQRIIDNLEEILRVFQSRKDTLQSFDAAQVNDILESLDIAYFAYQGLDLTEIAIKVAKITQFLLDVNQPELMQFIRSRFSDHIQPQNHRRIRVGYLGTCLKDHVVGYLSQGWIQYHDRSLFEIFCYSLSSETDQIAKTFQQYSDRFYIFHHTNLGLFQQILDDNIDILVFLDLNVGTSISWLSVLRLAPIQCGFWGNPMSSGSAAMDYFLSSHLMESWAAQHHYSEALIYLPNIASCYLPEAISIVPVNHQDFGLSPHRIIYLFTQTLLKHLPQYDYIFAEIARQVPQAQFIFLERPDEYIAAAFFHRLTDAFMTRNLNIHEYCITLPVLPKDKFYGLQRLAHVALDSFGWSGGITTLDAIACDLPVVTYPGEFMRGRHSYGILQRLGVTETIAHSEKEYIDIAVQLGLDRIWNDQIREKIKRNKQKLYGDQNCIKGLETFYRCVFDKRHTE